MSVPVQVSSANEFSTLLKTTSIVVADCKHRLLCFPHNSKRLEADLFTFRSLCGLVWTLPRNRANIQTGIYQALSSGQDQLYQSQHGGDSGHCPNIPSHRVSFRGIFNFYLSYLPEQPCPQRTSLMLLLSLVHLIPRPVKRSL